MLKKCFECCNFGQKKVHCLLQKTIFLVMQAISFGKQTLKNKVCPCFRLSVSFLGIGSLVFSETQHVVRGPSVVVCDTAGFFGKNTHRAKMTKHCQKYPQIHDFLDILRKLRHQFCLEFVQNESSYGSLTFCENCMLGKNLILKLQPKMSLGQLDLSIL